ncbi:MAG: hypothetical protein QM731_18830 [Chitinophagaceae bacterium]
MKAKFILAVLMITFVSIGANAQSIKEKNRHEHARIANGVRSGELTHREARHLKREHRHIHHNMRKAKRNDGRVGMAERKHIRHEQRKFGHDINRAKHNNRKWS